LEKTEAEETLSIEDTIEEREAIESVLIEATLEANTFCFAKDGKTRRIIAKKAVIIRKPRRNLFLILVDIFFIQTKVKRKKKMDIKN